MQSLTIQRNPQIIAAEINSIKEQTQRILLHNSIEIGRRLTEAKDLVGHGNWTEWLETYVEYSQRTASNLIRIFEEFGSKQITFLDDNSNSQALANLTYTQAVALLGIPQEERENFVEENKIDEMTTRQLTDAIKERDKVLKEKKELEKKLGVLESDLQRETDTRLAVESSMKLLEGSGASEEVESLRSRLKELEEQLESESSIETAEDSEELEQQRQLYKELEDKLNAAEKTIKSLKEKASKEPEHIEVIPQSMKDELELLRKKIQAGEKSVAFTLTFKTAQRSFNDILEMIQAMDEEMASKCNKAVRALCEQMMASV